MDNARRRNAPRAFLFHALSAEIVEQSALLLTPLHVMVNDGCHMPASRANGSSPH